MLMNYSFFRQLMQETGAKLKSFHFIGHSLGAHICSYVSFHLGGVSRITGLLLIFVLIFCVIFITIFKLFSPIINITFRIGSSTALLSYVRSI